MKTKILILLLSAALVLPVIAQTDPYPTRQEVESTLEFLEECKKDKKETEKRLASMEANPDNYTLAEYRFAKKFLKELNQCIKSCRKDLEVWRKNYPGWFNSPSAFVDLRIHAPGFRDPPEVERALDNMMKSYNDMMKRFEKLLEPEH